MLALSIRQPYAELILRGVKTIEYRSRSTRVVGERFYLYASRGGGDWRRAGGRGRAGARTGTATAGKKAWSLDLAMGGPAGADGRADFHHGTGPGRGLPPWMAELADALRLFPHALETGVIVGSAVIERVSPFEPGHRDAGGEDASQRGGGPVYQWHLTDVRRLKRPLRPSGHPQPVWFRPF